MHNKLVYQKMIYNVIISVIIYVGINNKIELIIAVEILTGFLKQ
jgi:hypothetical protein